MITVILYGVAIILTFMVLIGLIKTILGIALELLYLGGVLAVVAVVIWVLSRIF